MSLTTPTMTWELEQACHCLSRHALVPHLNQKYGEGKWQHAGMGLPGRVENGITILSNDQLAADAVDAGLVELRKQLADFDAPSDLFAKAAAVTSTNQQDPRD